MSASWTTLMGGIRYGFKPFYILELEGIRVLLTELVDSPLSGGEPIAPTGYTLDASLIIDDSARVGPVVDDRTHLSRGFDLGARLRDTAAVRALMARPTAQTYLTADVTDTDTAFPVESTRGFAGVSAIYYGVSCSDTFSPAGSEFTAVARGDFGPGRSYKAGTVISDTPRVWKGRRARLYMALIDPLGRIVQGASVLTDACVFWEGHVYQRPYKDGPLWVIECRDQVRRLAEPLGIAASGQAVWTLDDDHPIRVLEQTTITFRAYLEGAAVGGLGQLVIQPFIGLTDPIARSRIRQLIADALYAAWVDQSAEGEGSPPALVSFYWQCIRIDGPSGGMKRVWQLKYSVDTQSNFGAGITGKIISKLAIVGNAMQIGFRVVGAGYGETWTADSADVTCDTALFQDVQVSNAGLAVILEEGTFSRLPSSGWALLESGGVTEYRRYIDATQDTADFRRVNLELEPNAMTGEQIQRLAADELAGELQEVTAKFLWRDAGTAPDVMRRGIMSSGDGTNGAHDTLAKGQGYDLPYVDTTSFDNVFDGGFADLSFDLAVDGGSSFEKMFSGLLRLSQRAIVTRRAADGSSVDIAAISVGSPDAIPVATITSDMLVAAGGRRPVRARDAFRGPQAIDISCHRMPVGTLAAQEAKIELNDEHLSDWTSERWELAVHGLPRSALVLPATAWGIAWFRGGENRQVVELDVCPWFDGEADIQAGDIVMLELPYDPTLFDFAAGTSGLTGLGRVIGAPFALDTGVVTLWVQTDGINTPGPMSPSLPIEAVNGGATTPTSIDVDEAYYDLLVYGKGGEASWKVLAYLPGQDSGRAEYTVSTVTLPGGGVARLTVTAYPSAPSVTLSTSYRLTWPIMDECTTEQGRFLHTSHRVQWS